MQACKRVNLTVSYARYPENEFGNFDQQQKKIIGEQKELILDNYFLKRKHETQEEVLKHCTFRGFEEEGRLLPNGSWTGAIGGVVAGSADVTFRVQKRIIEPGLVDHSDIWGSEDIAVGHYIDERPKTRPIINFEAIWNILVPSTAFSLEYLTVFVFSLLFIYLLGRFLKKKNNFVTAFAFNLFAQTKPFRRCSVVSLFFVWNLAFIFFIKQILSNNVNTEKVVVSNEPILDTVDKLIRTKKDICFPLKEDLDLALHSDISQQGMFFEMVYENLQRQERPCCLEDYLANPKGISERKFFLVYAEVFINFLKVFNPIVKKDIFISENGFGTPFGMIVYYLSKGIDKRAKEEFNRQTNIYFEGGFKQKMFRSVHQIFDQKFPRVKNTNVFRTARDYVKHNTMISDVKMNDFSFVYLFYICQAIILLIFVLHCNIGLLLCISNSIARNIRSLVRRILNKLNKLKIRGRVTPS